MSKYSRVIAGCMSWGAWGKQFSKEEMIQQIHTTIASGISTFDHADIYGDYTTETEFGNAFIESGVQRENIQLISKCGIQYVGQSRENKIKHYNYSKEYIIWSTERSLRELRTDYLDLLLLHRPSPLMHPDEIAEAIQQLQEQGKILEFGVSNFTPSQVSLIHDKIQVSANQIEFSLSQHTAMHNGSLDQMLEKGITPMCWSPLGSVFKEDSEANRRVHEILEVLSEKYAISKDGILLSWILQHPAGVQPVIGTTNPERIRSAVKAVAIELELEDWFSLLVAYQGHKVP